MRSNGSVRLNVSFSLELNSSDVQRIDRIKSTLFSDLDHLFGTTLVSLVDGRAGKTLDVDRTKLMGDVTECLKTYDVLGLWRDAEDVLRREVVESFVKKVSTSCC